MQFIRRHLGHISVLAAVFLTVLLATVVAESQYYKSELTPPPADPGLPASDSPSDSLLLPARVMPTVPRGYEDYTPGEYPADLRTPSNIKTEAVYDPESHMYVLRTTVGDREIVTPYMMTAEEYTQMMMRKDMYGYFKEKNAESYEKK